MGTYYKDAIDDARLDAAVGQIIRQSPTASPAILHELANRAVEETFCFCVTGAEDAVEGHVSTIHAALVEEVVRRVRAFLRK